VTLRSYEVGVPLRAISPPLTFNRRIDRRQTTHRAIDAYSIAVARQLAAAEAEVKLCKRQLFFALPTRDEIHLALDAANIK